MIGVNPMNQDNEKGSLYTTIVQFQEIAVKRFKYIWLQPKFLFNLTKYSKIVENCSNYANKLFADQISKKHKDIESENEYKGRFI